MVWVDRFFHTMSCYSFLNWLKKHEGDQQEDDRWAAIFTVVPIVLCQFVFLGILYVIGKLGYVALAIVVALCLEAMCSNFIWYDSVRKLTTLNVLKRSQKFDGVEKQRAYTAGVFICFAHMLIKALAYYTLLTLASFSSLIYIVVTASALQAFCIILAATMAKKTIPATGYGINIANNIKIPQFIIGFMLSCMMIFLSNYWLYGLIAIITSCIVAAVSVKTIEQQHDGIFEEAICAIGEMVFILFILSQIFIAAIL